MHFGKKKETPLKISYGSEGNELKTQVIKNCSKSYEPFAPLRKPSVEKVQKKETMNTDIPIQLSKEEIHMIYNALNEISNGIDIPEFELRMGYPEARFQDLLEKIGTVLDSAVQ